MKVNKIISHNPQQIMGLCIAIVIAVSYWPVIDGDFINLDDDDYILDNRHVNTGLSNRNIIWAFTHSHAANWHPLTWISHMTDCELYGLNPSGHHVTSLLLHIINALMLFLLFRRMSLSLRSSFMIAILFAVHPINVESVAWIAERKNVLSTFFMIVTLLFYWNYIQMPRRSTYMYMALFFSLGLMAKPALVILPFLFLLIDFWPAGRVQLSGYSRQRKEQKRRYHIHQMFIEKVPLFILATISSMITYVTQDAAGATASGYPLSVRVGNAVVSYCRYLQKMVLPLNLAVPYPHRGMPQIPHIIISTMLIMGITIVVSAKAKRKKWLVTGWFWYLGTLIPVIGLIQVGPQAMADRYAYISFIGLFIIVSLTADKIFKSSPRIKMVGYAMGAGIVILFAVMTRKQACYWKNSTTLFIHTLKIAPVNPLAHANLGVAYLSNKQYENAKKHLTIANKMAPTLPVPLYNLGIIAANEGNIKKAIRLFRTVIRVDSTHTEAYHSLGEALEMQGCDSCAIDLYKKALAIDSLYWPAHLGLGRQLFKQHKLDSSYRRLATVISLNYQNWEAHNFLGFIHARKKKCKKAVFHFTEAIKYNDGFWELYNNLGYILLKCGNYRDALKTFSVALSLNPRSKNAYFNRAKTYRALGEFEAAITDLKKAVSLDPDFIQAIDLLEKTTRELGFQAEDDNVN
ncbi:MAG: tetratricopeptide repeat protein [Chitinivibrionales bacterium]|nr:tetratricopeptide repeat protein [Chitinivibrionales bacterium]